MKKKHLLLLLMIVSCQPKISDKNCINYIISQESISSIKEFINESDPSQILYLQQNILDKNDSSLKVENIWKRKDSIVINKSIETYFSNGNYTIESQSLTEFDATNNTALEVKAKISNQKATSFLNDLNSFDFQYSFKTDSALIMRMHYETIGHFKKSDTLGLNSKNNLIIKSKEKTILAYNDRRKDTVIYSESTKIFGKDKGLVYFSQKFKDQHNIAYRLNQ